MPTVFEWKQSEFDKLIANCPDEPVTPFIFKYFQPGSRLLESGCGSGRFVHWLASKGYDIEGMEISVDTVEMLHHHYHHLKITQGDVRQLPYADNSFDGILSLGVIEHVVEGMEQSIQEMHRVLRPGGIALVIVPSYNLIRRWKFRTGIYHLHALMDMIKRWSIVRQLFGKPLRPIVPNPKLDNPPSFKRWPMFGEFFEYRLTKAQFEAQLAAKGFTIVESIPTSQIDGIYHEFGRLFVRLENLTFYPTLAGRWLNDFLSSKPFWHNHMHLCVVRK